MGTRLSAGRIDFGSSTPGASDLLIVTDQDNHSHGALTLPFREATVVYLEPGEELHILGSFDAAVLDLHRIDRQMVEPVLAALRPGARIATVLPQSLVSYIDFDVLTPELLAWDGVTTLGGRLCAVFRPAADGTVDSTSIPSQITAVASAFEFGAATSADTIADLRMRIAQLEASLDALANLRQRSEKALIAQIDHALRELEAERRSHRGLRLIQTVLRRHRLGRVLLRLLRPFVRAVRTLRQGRIPGHARLRRALAPARR
jgi:hypothetical protein